MSRLALAVALLPSCLLACSGGDGGKGKGDDDDDTVDPFDQFIHPDGAARGDFACFTPGVDASAFLAPDIDPGKQAQFPIAGLVEDFENHTAVASANVDLFYGDDPTGLPDASTQSDVSGLVSTSGPSCTPVSYRVNTVGGPVATRETVKLHQVYGYPTGAGITNASFVSVSDTTYQLIPGFLGVQIQPGLSIVAGTAYDCARDPEQASDDPVGKIEGVQVVVLDANGDVPDTLGVNYFIKDFPDRDQLQTSPDGLWVASNVPPGPVEVQMWGNVDGELVLLGTTHVDAAADGLEIANVFAGYDGVKPPATCAAGG